MPHAEFVQYILFQQQNSQQIYQRDLDVVFFTADFSYVGLATSWNLMLEIVYPSF